MKDAYSFDVDEEGLAKSFELQRGAYHRIFERCGSSSTRWRRVRDDWRQGVPRLPLPNWPGENTLVLCERGDYAADLEIASGVPRPVEFPERLERPRRSQPRT